MDFQAIIRASAAQGTVLLKNEGSVLPLKNTDKVSLFGRCHINYYKCGTGSGGSVHTPYSINIPQGFEILKNEGFAVPEINGELVKVYEDWIKAHPYDSGNGEWASEPWCQVEMELSDSLVKNCSEKTDKAVYVIGRTAGEDQDNNRDKGSFYITDTERSNIALICRYFKNVIVILNVSNVIDVSWIDDEEFGGNIRAVLFTWQGGMQGGQACADVLCGKSVPSGKLTDTIAYKLEDYASTKNFGSSTDEIYEEDIYVGYRYFTTFAKEKIQFPFGFGLSYTTFEISDGSYSRCGEKIYVSATVLNTGTVSGREVVQIYCQQPQGKLGKSERILCGFKKTKELQPGESETVKIEIPVKYLASYDDSGATGFAYSYVLEEGTYSFFAGTDCLTENKIFLGGVEGQEFTVEKTYVLEKLTQVCAPEKAFNRIKPGEKKADGTYELEKEPVPLNKVDMAKRIQENLPAEIRAKGTPCTDFSEVVKDKSLVDNFIANLSLKELMTIVRGEGMMSRKVTAGIASAFGGVSEALHEKKMPAIGCCDGPSGIRLDNGKPATLVPIGTLLACTWNPEIVVDLYEELGKEMVSKNIDVLLGPGCNIHRNPLNGRNFEYFSEDPLVTGVMSVAVCRGLEKAGTFGTIKHFALNNQEEHRRTENSCASERAIREIYLKPFEIAIKEGGAKSVMTSYNGVNGHKSASNFDLNTIVLRNEWKFDGMVMTDWWAAMNDCVKGGDSTGRNISEMIRARNDVYMVVVNDTADKGGFGDNLEEAIKNGNLSMAQLQLCVKDILLFIAGTKTAHLPLRPLKNEITVNTVLASVPAGAKIYKLEEYATEEEIKSGTVYFEAAEDANYEVFGGYVKDGGDTLSQSITNVLLNGETCGSFECRSTDNRIVYSVAVQLKLKKGFYKVEIDHTKPGIKVAALCLRIEEDSPISTGEYE